MHISPKWYLNDLFSKIDSAPLVGNLIDTYHANFSADRDNSLAGSASQKIWYWELFLQLRKWCNLSNGLNGFMAALIACTSYTKNGMHSDHWFPAPLLKLFSSTLNKLKRPVNKYLRHPRHNILPSVVALIILHLFIALEVFCIWS